MDIDKILEAGRIAKEAREYAQKLCKSITDGLELAIKVEEFIKKRAKLAFPVNVSIHNVAAHFSPIEPIEMYGVVKIDLGANVDGYLSDTAFSCDLDGNYEELVEASKKALENASKIMRYGVTLSEIGKTIEETIKSYGFNPIKNLTGHSIEYNQLHGGLYIPNYDNGDKTIIKEGLYAIEPFATMGKGYVRNGPPSNIYILVKPKRVRDIRARKVLQYIIENYGWLPFAKRWLIEEFGPIDRELYYLLKEGIIYSYPQLIEEKPVSQFEHTFLVLKDKTIITTL